MFKLQKSKYIAFGLAFVFLAVSGTAQAATFRVASEERANVSVNKGEQITNLYTAGNIVTVDADVTKGVHAAGNIVTINGNVGHSIYSGAGTLIVGGNVAGSIHGGSGSMVIEGNVSEDVLVGAGHLLVSDGATIGGDLAAGAGTLDVQGSVGGNVYVAGGLVTIGGQINGDVTVKEADKLTIESDAVINGNLEYFSKEEIVIEEGAVINGETIVAEKGISGTEDIDKGMLAGAIFAIVSVLWLVKLFGLTVIGLIAVYLFRRMTGGMVDEATTNFWRSLGIGIAVLILMPIVAVLTMFTAIGFWLGMLIMLIYLTTLFIASVLTGVTVGSWLATMFKKEKRSSSSCMDWKTVLTGTIAVMIIGILPVIGWFLALVLILINLGGLYRSAFRTRG